MTGSARPTPLRLLLVDDEAGIRDSLQLFLERQGIQVVTAIDGEQALEKLDAESFNAVLTDVSMPGSLSGLDVLRHVKEHHLETDVLIMTGHLDVDYAIQALKFGASDYFKKPFVFDEVIVALQRAEERRTLLQRSRELDRLRSRQETASSLHTQTMVSLAAMLEAKNPYTRAHSERVSGYARYLGQELGLGHREIHVLTVGGKLHDIGKIGTPEAVLNKKGRLDESEWELIRQHPVCGYELLKPLSFMKPYLPIVRWHHERLDGTGYPDRLQGDQIPRIVQIVKVADMYDAITSKRPYRKPMSLRGAIDILQEEVDDGGVSGDIVEAFVRVLESAPWRAEPATV